MDMQCKYQQVDTKEEQQVFGIFIDVKLQHGSKKKRKLQSK